MALKELWLCSAKKLDKVLSIAHCFLQDGNGTEAIVKLSPFEMLCRRTLLNSHIIFDSATLIQKIDIINVGQKQMALMEYDKISFQ